jgi:3-methyladenine DNA glycosylase/8-oxoguanine DNA glycosylase
MQINLRATQGLEPQVARIIGVERDPAPFYAMARRDQVLSRLLAEEPGFRAVVFFSPWAAAGWSGFRGLSQEKWSPLQSVAKAALAGELSMAALAQIGARERLRKLRGVGTWTAEAVLHG